MFDQKVLGMGIHSCQKKHAAVYAVTAVLALISVAPSLAQTTAAPANDKAAVAPKKSNDAALKAYGAGTRAYESGRTAEAVQSLSTALSAGGLPANQMAKALYYRGMSQKKLGKPALAISDLTSAIWLKGGLSDVDRANAIQARQQAHKEAGLGDVAPPIPEQTAVAAAPAAPAAVVPAAPQTAAPIAAAPSAVPEATAPVVAAAPVVAPAAVPAQSAAPQSSVPDAASILSGAVTTSPPPTVVAAAAPEPTVAAATAPTATPASNSLPWVSTSQAEAAPTIAAPVSVTAAATPSTPSAVVSAPSLAGSPDAPVLSAVPTGDPAPPVTNVLSGAGQAVTGFFGNVGKNIGSMFGGGNADAAAQATQTASSQVATSSTGPSAPETQAWQPQTSSWGSPDVKATDSAKPAAPKKTAAVAAPVAAPKKVAAAAAGNYKLQVAAVRSREEAERISAGVTAMPAVQGAARSAIIDEANITGMGTYYRVRLGPFSDAAEPGKLCTALKPQGYDCLVVAQ